jgi:PEP-CTERM motif
MFKLCILCIAAGIAILIAASGLAQSTTLLPNITPVTSGADFVPGWRSNHHTFDLRSTTPLGSFWVGAEILVDVVGSGTIWHASDQRDPDGDPNTPVGDSVVNNNLFPSLSPQPPPDNTAAYDTYMIAPAAGGEVGDPMFAAPGGVHSTPTHIHGWSPKHEIPLAWFTFAQFAHSDFRIARFTLAFPGTLSLTRDATHPLAFATLVGRSATNLNPTGINFNYTIYQSPEPDTFALLALGALAGLLRRR